MTENDRPGESHESVTPASDAKSGVTKKPMSEWTVEDFLAIGVQAQLSTAKVRVSNTATGVPGGQRTGIQIGTTFNRGFKFAK